MKICPQCGAEYELDQRFCPRDGTTLRTQGGEADLVGSVVADRYHVLRKLGEGGMGQVYLAEHVKMGRKSALKVMHPKMVQDAEAIARFNREASNASRINHPNVAAIYDFGETTEGIIYLAMEFVEGEPLTNIIARLGASGSAVPPMRAAEIVRQTAEALNVAHDMGIVHRDLKPDNIMVGRTRDGTDLVKVVDFGIAKAADTEGQNVTRTGLIVGTPEYMSPEQIAGDRLDGRSDQYSLALVAFNMLTGTLPFPAASAQESLILRLTDAPRTLGESRPEVQWPPALQAVMDRALARDMAQRYARTTDFARELVRAVEAMPDTQMAAAGTLVMSAPAGASSGASSGEVPATRVASLRSHPDPERRAGEGSASSATSAVPSLATPDVAALRKPVSKNRLPLYATLAATLVVAVWGGSVLFRGSAASAANTPAEPFASDVQGQVATPAAATSPASYADSLDSLDALVDLARGTREGAERALPVLDALQSKLVTNEDVVHAEVLRAWAFSILGNEKSSCDAFARVELNAPGTRWARDVADGVRTCASRR
ncbi:MAG: serine/threonine-protein kinase [Gemmatimonadaceae bacterium]